MGPMLVDKALRSPAEMVQLQTCLHASPHRHAMTAQLVLVSRAQPVRGGAARHGRGCRGGGAGEPRRLGRSARADVPGADADEIVADEINEPEVGDADEILAGGGRGGAAAGPEGEGEGEGNHTPTTAPGAVASEQGKTSVAGDAGDARAARVVQRLRAAAAERAPEAQHRAAGRQATVEGHEPGATACLGADPRIELLEACGKRGRGQEDRTRRKEWGRGGRGRGRGRGRGEGGGGRGRGEGRRREGGGEREAEGEGEGGGGGGGGGGRGRGRGRGEGEGEGEGEGGGGGEGEGEGEGGGGGGGGGGRGRGRGQGAGGKGAGGRGRGEEWGWGGKGLKGGGGGEEEEEGEVGHMLQGVRCPPVRLQCAWRVLRSKKGRAPPDLSGPLTGSPAKEITGGSCPTPRRNWGPSADQGSRDGRGMEARFRSLDGIVVDVHGNM